MGIVKDFDKNEFTGFFDNYKFFINPDTNEIETKFICTDCKTVMTKEEMLQGRYQLKVAGQGGPLSYHTARFFCKECATIRRERNNKNNE